MLDVKFKGGVMTVRGCLPHYRRPLSEIVELRERLHKRLADQHVAMPITRKIHLRVFAKRHADGGDLSNILQAVCQAVDGCTLGEPKILVSDGLLDYVSAQWLNHE